MTLRRITDGFVLEGLPADKPAAGDFPYAAQAGTEFWPTDGSPPEITGYNGLGQIVWLPLFGGGGGVTIATTGAPINVAGGPAYTLDFGFAGQADGDVIVRQGGAWVRLPVGAPGDVLTVVAGAPAWQAPGGGGGVTSVSATPGQGIAVTGAPATPSVGVSTPGQVSGDLLYRDPSSSWVSLPAGADGEIPTADTLGPDRVVFYRAISASEPIQYAYSGGHALSFGYAAQAAGDLCYAPGPAPAGWVRLPLGNTGDFLRVQSGSPTWVRDGAENAVTLYVAGVTGSDANDGLSPGTPVATIARVMELLPSVATGNVTVLFAPEPVTETTVPRWFLPGVKGSATARSVLFDAPLTETRAPDPCTGGIQGFGTSFGTVTVVGPLVPNAFAGQILQWTSGIMAGQCYRIRSNSGVSLTICGAFFVAPTPGDTFRIVEESVVVTLPAAPTPGIMAGFAMAVNGIRFDLNGQTLVLYGQLGYNCASFGGTSGTLVVAQLGGLTAANQLFAPTPSVGFQPSCGPRIGQTIQAIDGGRVDLEGFLVQSGAGIVGVKNCQLLLNGGYFAAGAGGVEVTLQSSLEATALVADGISAQAFLFARFHSAIVALSVLCDSNATGDILRLENHSSALVNDLTGSLNAGFGLRALTHSRASVPDANVLTVGTGALGDCQVGGNAAPATWAQIAGGAAVDVLDTAAALPQYCAVQP